MSIPILTVGEDGRVDGANRAARRVLGHCIGLRCCDVIRARDRDGLPVCSTHCAQRLAMGHGVERDAPVRVRKEPRRLYCSAVGNHAVVTLLPSEDPAPAEYPLTPREREVLRLVAEGLTARQIAGRLGIRPSTARTHVENLREKLGARTRAEAVARAMQLGQLG